MDFCVPCNSPRKPLRNQARPHAIIHFSLAPAGGLKVTTLILKCVPGEPLKISRFPPNLTGNMFFMQNWLTWFYGNGDLSDRLDSFATNCPDYLELQIVCLQESCQSKIFLVVIKIQEDGLSYFLIGISYKRSCRHCGRGHLPPPPPPPHSCLCFPFDYSAQQLYL